MDGRTEKMMDEYVEPAPEHLAIVIESKERAIVSIAKYCIRRNDTPVGRQIKLNHYIALYKKYMGEGFPDDLHLFIRKPTDVPMFFKREVMDYLKKIGWKPRQQVGLPTLINTYPTKANIADIK